MSALVQLFSASKWL